MKNSTLASYLVIAALVSGIGLVQVLTSDSIVTASLPLQFGNGDKCESIKCADGREFPRCKGRSPINYFADPCWNPSTDAKCGNGKCEEGEADKCFCPDNNPYCKAPCLSGTCPRDCEDGGDGKPVCGNGECEEGEADICPCANRNDNSPRCMAPCKSGTCPRDCRPQKPICGNGKCEEGEEMRCPPCMPGKPCKCMPSRCPEDCGGKRECPDIDCLLPPVNPSCRFGTPHFDNDGCKINCGQLICQDCVNQGNGNDNSNCVDCLHDMCPRYSNEESMDLCISKNLCDRDGGGGQTKCAEEGENVFYRSEMGPTKCCRKLVTKPAEFEIGGYCSAPDNGSKGICVEHWNCGNGRCDNGEDKCSCNVDCRFGGDGGGDDDDDDDDDNSNLDELKRAYESAKKEKSDAWQNYLSAKEDAKQTYLDDNKEAWNTYKSSNVEAFGEYNEKKSEAYQIYLGIKKKAAKVYLDARNSAKEEYSDASAEYETAKATYKECREDKEEDCSSEQDAYRDTSDDKKEAVAEYIAVKERERAKYEAARDDAKEEYMDQRKDARAEYDEIKKEKRAEYYEIKAEAKSEYKATIDDARAVYNDAKQAYLDTQTAYNKARGRD